MYRRFQRLAAWLTCFALLAGLLPVTARADTINSVPYLDERGGQQTADNVTVVDGSNTWNGGWYVVNSNVTISSRITVSGSVNLILADGYTLTASQGITVA